jgi:hypothetical protein
MESKTFEIRDANTFIPVLATKLSPANERDRYLFARAGYGVTSFEQSSYILLCRIYGGGGPCQSDHYEWGNRTLTYAHRFIEENFDALITGAVIDVEFILGERTEPKKSEQEENQSYAI